MINVVIESDLEQASRIKASFIKASYSANMQVRKDDA